METEKWESLKKGVGIENVVICEKTIKISGKMYSRILEFALHEKIEVEEATTKLIETGIKTTWKGIFREIKREAKLRREIEKAMKEGGKWKTN